MDPWSVGREVARDVLRSLPKLEKMSDFCHRRGIEICSRLCSVHQRPNVFSQTPGRRRPHITGLRVNSVTLGWVGAPNERALFRFHDAIAVFADRCLTRTRIADQGLEGGIINIARAKALANKHRVSCPEEYKICRFGQVCNSTGHITPAIYQSNPCMNASQASHLPMMSPRWAKSPRIHSTPFSYRTNI